MSDKQRPFSHQQEAFNIVANQRKSLYMIAGTAAGKTLAIGLPLFHLLKHGEIRRVLFMYPTLALLDDQRRVMEKLARITKLKVAEIKGGMTRNELIGALNCPVILATPDAIYWFFRKNVKFSSLLIYGLTQIDAFVLDEAHLFNGLSLRSLALLRERVLILANQLNKQPQWHILTATPHDDLRALTTNGVEVRGKSKCGPVGFDLLEPRETITEGRSQMITAVNQALQQGAKKVLLVFNSAAEAHSRFRPYHKNEPELPSALKLKYGRVWLSSLRKWMLDEGIAEAASREVKKAIAPYATVPLCELNARGQITLKSADVMTAITTLFDIQMKFISNGLQAKDRSIRDKLARQLLDAVGISETDDLEISKNQVNHWLSERITELEDLWSDAEITVKTPDALGLLNDLEAAGFSERLSQEIHRRLLHMVKVSKAEINKWGHVPESMRSHQVMVSWAVNQVSDLDERSYFQEMLADPIAQERLQISFPNVGLWADSGVPVILYSGKMARDERDGQIRLFDELERAVLISTSAVEVGVDFDADVLITEQCPGPDLLQRFGRIGRREGIQGRVILQVHDRQAYFQLRQRLEELPTLSREDFSQIVTELFPPRRYVSSSIFLDATHWLINDQLGSIGYSLNEAMFTPDVAHLAEQVRRADLSFAFGLRGTMPQVTLRDGVTLSPFYGLRKIHNDSLWPSDSPFALAQANMNYTRFVYDPSEWEVIVDCDQTVQQSQALFHLGEGRWQISVNKGIARDYFTAMGNRSKAEAVISLMRERPEEYQRLVLGKPDHPAARLGSAIQQLQTEKRNLILGFGDVYLKRLHREGVNYPMEDVFGTPLRLVDQVWLLIIGDVLETERHLEKLGFLDVEEITRVKCDDNQTILIESMVGATFQVFERWTIQPSSGKRTGS